MVNKQSQSNTGTQFTAKICSVNICGLSQRSHMMLDKYVHDHDILLLSLQETGTINNMYKNLSNMTTFQDTNKQINKGCAIMVRTGTTFTQLTELSKLSKNFDTVWGILRFGGKSYLIGNVYLKLDCLQGVKDLLLMLDKAYNLAKFHKCSGLIVMGDFNARHHIWNDTTINNYGKHLEQNLDWTRFCIKAPSCSTFLAKNGGSLIDFFITSTALDHFAVNPRTDYEANLFTGAPIRGHTPIFLDILSKCSLDRNTVEYKLNLATMDWESWTLDIEWKLRRGMVDNLATDDNIDELWKTIDAAIQTATDSNCQLKCISKHSKPYWTAELTKLSSELKVALKCYLTRNTDDSFSRYQTAKRNFEDARKAACQSFIMKNTNNLNTAQSSKFWKDFNRLFKPGSNQQVEALIGEGGTIISDNEEIEKEMFETFFMGKHISQNLDAFDSNFHDEVHSIYDDIIANDFKHSEETEGVFAMSSSLYNPISPEEVWYTIREKKSYAESFDNGRVHPSMLKNLGRNAIYALTKLFMSPKWLLDLERLQYSIP